jgi:general secretion pathway protein D
VRLASCILGIALAFLLVPGEAPGARPRDRARRGGIPVHYADREISEIVTDIAHATGLRFVFGDELRGRVTITVPGRVEKEEALELLYAALYMRGFAAIPLDDETIRIVPVLETTASAPLDRNAVTTTGERSITTLIELDEISADEAVAALAPYVSGNGVAVAHPPTNSVILAGTEGQVVRLMTIARILDAASLENVMVRSVRYRDVGFVADMIDRVFNETPIEANHVEIWTDDRTQQVIVRGHPAALAEIRSFIDGLDVAPMDDGKMHVVRVYNRDVEQLAELLTSLAAGSGSTPRPVAPRALPVANAVVADLSEDLVDRAYHIEVDKPTSSLLIVADDMTFETLARLIAELDKLAPRVAVDVLLFELSLPSGFKLGTNYFAGLVSAEGGSILTVETQSVDGAATGPTGDSVAFGQYTRRPVTLTIDTPQGPITIRPPSEDVSIQAGERNAETTILLRPHIVGVTGEEHEVFAGDNIPVPSASTAASTSGATTEDGTPIVDPLQVTQTIERVDVGSMLRVKPTLGEDGAVRLEVVIEVSQVVASRAGPVEEVGPTFADRNIEATITLMPGQRAVIGSTGGAIKSRNRIGIPFLMNIPYFGYLFSTYEERTDQVDLIAVIEARVIRSNDDDVAETIRRRLAFERAISRTTDMTGTAKEPFAVLLESGRSESAARQIAEAFSADGFETRIISWDAWGQVMWDVYLTRLATFDEAAALSRQLAESGWSPEITLLSPVNELAGD